MCGLPDASFGLTVCTASVNVLITCTQHQRKLLSWTCHLHTCHLHTCHLHTCHLHTCHLHTCHLHTCHLHTCQLHTCHLHTCHLHTLPGETVKRNNVVAFNIKMGYMCLAVGKTYASVQSNGCQVLQITYKPAHFLDGATYIQLLKAVSVFVNYVYYRIKFITIYASNMQKTCTLQTINLQPTHGIDPKTSKNPQPTANFKK